MPLNKETKGNVEVLYILYCLWILFSLWMSSVFSLGIFKKISFVFFLSFYGTSLFLSFSLSLSLSFSLFLPLHLSLPHSTLSLYLSISLLLSLFPPLPHSLSLFPLSHSHSLSLSLSLLLSLSLSLSLSPCHSLPHSLTFSLSLSLPLSLTITLSLSDSFARFSTSSSRYFPVLFFPTLAIYFLPTNPVFLTKRICFGSFMSRSVFPHGVSFPSTNREMKETSPISIQGQRSQNYSGDSALMSDKQQMTADNCHPVYCVTPCINPQAMGAHVTQPQ